MRRERLFFAIPLLMVLSALTTSSADDKVGPYTQLTTIAIPGGLAGFDISWVDTATETYFLSDRTATLGTGRIDVIDAEHDSFLFSIPGFVGNGATHNVSGPDGVVAIHKRGELGAGEGHDRIELWAGDGDSTVKVVNLETRSIVDSISTGGVDRADELCYDPTDKIVLIANDADMPPFVTFISAQTHAVLGHISYPQSTGGLEQCLWDAQRHRFYIAVPATTANTNGEVDEINPHTESVTRVFAIANTAFAGPAGLALLPGQRLITSTGVVFSAVTGATLATIPNVSGDEIWYNSGDNRVYFGASPMPVVDASTYAVVANLPVGNTHSVAADSENNRIFVPSSSPAPNNGVQVFTDDEDQEGRPGK